jgi:hypothetical protein
LLEARLRQRVHLQVQALEGDERDEQVVHIQAVPAEHCAGTHRTQRGEQFQAVGDEGVIAGRHVTGSVGFAA